MDDLLLITNVVTVSQVEEFEVHPLEPLSHVDDIPAFGLPRINEIIVNGKMMFFIYSIWLKDQLCRIANITNCGLRQNQTGGLVSQWNPIQLL